MLNCTPRQARGRSQHPHAIDPVAALGRSLSRVWHTVIDWEAWPTRSRRSAGKRCPTSSKPIGGPRRSLSGLSDSLVEPYCSSVLFDKPNVLSRQDRHPAIAGS